MEITLYLFLFVVGFILFLISTVNDEYDISNTYQVQLTFLSMIVWVAVLYSSFNIQIFNGSFAIHQIVDYGYIGIAFAMFIISFLNMIVLGLVGSWNALFNVARGKTE